VTRAIPRYPSEGKGIAMHGLIRRFAVAAGAAALTLGSAAGAVASTGTPVQAAAAAGTAAAAAASSVPVGPTTTYNEPNVIGSGPCLSNTYVVPAGVEHLQAVVKGQPGYDAPGNINGGSGGRAETVVADLTVTPGQSLNVFVAYSPNSDQAGSLGTAGGAADGNSDEGGNGGGASYIATSTATNITAPQPVCGQSSFLVIAGGGGGGGGDGLFAAGGNGGAAGFTAGAPGSAGGNDGCTSGAGGGGGTQTAGGYGGAGSPCGPAGGGLSGLPGSFLQGGCGGGCNKLLRDFDGAGGGGGGYYGGGGGGSGDAGGAGAGGGGSSVVAAGGITISAAPTTDPPSVSITPIAVAPAAPTGVSAVAGDQQATVSFTPPADNGGAPIESYTVYATAAKAGFDQMAFGTGSPIIVTNLTAGQQYKFTVTATNPAGEGPASFPSSGVPYRLPGPANITSATAGNGQATVAFTASNADQKLGNPITSYTITARAGVGVTSGPVAATATGTTSPITVAGLTNGTNYTVTVYATNGAGNGPESGPKVVTPATVPGAPTNVTAANTSSGTATGTADVSFTPPASDGGLPIQGYTAVSSPGGITGTAGPGASDVQVTGLTYGTSYTFTVYATNPVGNGPASAPSNAVTPAGIPSPPQVPGAAAVDSAPASSSLPPPPPDLGAAYVSCLPPASNGGSPVVSYTVTSSPGGITATGSSCPVLVTGLTDGTPYTFTVTATNADGGTSQPSQSTTKVIPRVAPAGPEPANDNFAKAQAISRASGSVSGTNVGATVETNEPTIQDNRGGASVWYKWVVPATGTYQFDTCTANPDVAGIIGAFTGNSVGNLTELQDGPSEFSCPNNADGSGETGATITISPIAGQTIYIKFDGLNPDSNANPPYVGAFTLEWSQQS
jgi:trimeric autotransporter adhesin